MNQTMYETIINCIFYEENGHSCERWPSQIKAMQNIFGNIRYRVFSGLGQLAIHKAAISASFQLLLNLQLVTAHVRMLNGYVSKLPVPSIGQGPFMNLHWITARFRM